MNLQNSQSVEQQRYVLESLAELNDQAYILSRYLHGITREVCQLLNSNWTIITICEEGDWQILASHPLLHEAGPESSFHTELSAILLQHGLLQHIDDVEHHLDHQEQLGSYTYSLGYHCELSMAESSERFTHFISILVNTVQNRSRSFNRLQNAQQWRSRTINSTSRND